MFVSSFCLVLVLARGRPGKLEVPMGYGNWCIFGWLLGLAQLLLHGALGLVLFWVCYYRGGFAWRDQPKLEFNYHPVLMISGFIYLAGNGTLFLSLSLSFFQYSSGNDLHFTAARRLTLVRLRLVLDWVE